MNEKPSRVWVAGDLEIVLASHEKHSAYISEWFSNHIGETHDNQRLIKEICPVGEDGEWWHIAGQDNPADRPTRLDSGPKDIAPGSEWQDGKAFLKLPRISWPFKRKFAKERKKQVMIPAGEVNIKKYRGILGTKTETSLVTLVEQVEHRVSQKLSPVTVSSMRATRELPVGPDHPENPVVKYFKGGHCTNDWEKLLKHTEIFFRWFTRVVNRKKSRETVSARNMAIVFWVKVASLQEGAQGHSSAGA